jgi:hypothetical protein
MADKSPEREMPKPAHAAALGRRQTFFLTVESCDFANIKRLSQ